MCICLRHWIHGVLLPAVLNCGCCFGSYLLQAMLPFAFLRKKALKWMISGLVLAELVVDLLYLGVYAVHPGFRMFGVGLVYGLIPYALVLLVCAVFEKIRCLHV